MKHARQALGGLLAAALAMLTVGGGVLLSLTESGRNPAATEVALASPPPSLTAIIILPTPVPATATSSPVPPSPTPLPTATDTEAPTLTPSPTLAFPTPVPTRCGPPGSWRPVVVERGDTLFGLALRYGVSVNEITNANCLPGTGLQAGTRLYLPPIAATVVVECGPPSDWGLYTIQQGENLFRLSLQYGVTLAAVQKANCLTNAADIRAGQQIYLPPEAAMTATPALTPGEDVTPGETPTAAETPPELPTDTPAAPPTETLVPP